ncbi:trimeric intracellular cation channel family protein [Qingshengfaniella alkalisoli]|uniref:Trimeric intracellular cation channel family protein n=1 Tax=Qingshengfaniella alkalisoli TaxID=2599296 RepID=A0A5B8ITB8_9RHOB|nr:trimeric intracellular cation channel family protein [Qingshengfaniella alkalisoli]QDY68181.1 trimeric intracellular cation channel family protein [Qingshengfaniella alkalisoli]
MNPPVALDLAAVLVFAVSGALVASRAQLDIVGFVFIACLTAVGGGTVRDVLLNRHPVFWLDAPSYMFVATLASIIVFFSAHLLEHRYQVLLWIDALALSVAVSAGIAAAQSMDEPTYIVLLMGVITGCMGGLMRDVVCNEVPLALKTGEIYVTAALAGAIASVVMAELHPSPWLPLVACTVVCFLLRGGSLAFGWRIPVYKPRPPRNKG